MRFKLTIFVILVLALAFSLSSCNKEPENNDIQKDDSSSVLDIHIHDYKFSSETVPPTCTSDGYTIFKCQCGNTLRGNQKSRLPHSYGNAVTLSEPTFFESGVSVKQCVSCSDELITLIPAPTVSLIFSNEDGRDKLEISVSSRAEFDKHLLTVEDYSLYENITVSGTPIDLSEIETIYIGKNVISLPTYSFDLYTPCLTEVIFSKDIEFIGDMAFWNSENLEKIYFEGDAPTVGMLAFAQSHYNNPCVVLPSESSSGFSGLLFGGITIERPWLPDNSGSIFSLSLNEYAALASKSAVELANNILDLFKNGDQLEYAYIPYTSNIDEYKTIRAFTIELTKGCATNKEKIDVIYDWITDNIIYDDNALTYDPYDVFTTRRAVCAGYVTLMHDMLSAIDIVSFYTRGIKLFGNNVSVKAAITDRQNIESHAWLAVYNESEGFSFYDPTWGVIDKDHYRDMSVTDLGEDGVILEVDGLEVITELSSYKDYLDYPDDIQFIHDDGYIYVFNHGTPIFENYSTSYYNYQFTESYYIKLQDDIFPNDNQPKLTVTTTGLVFTVYPSDKAFFCRADGQLYRLTRILEYIDFRNTYYGTSLSIENDFVFENDGIVYKCVENALTVIDYVGNDECITIPSTVHGLPVKVIAVDAFRSCLKIKRVIIENGIEEIWVSAFYGCENLEYIYIPQSVRYNTNNEQNIGTSSIAFERCYSLSVIEVSPLNPVLASLDGNLYSKDMKELIAFAPNNEAKSFVLPASVKKISSRAFQYSKLDTVILHSNLEVICHAAFQHSEIKSITIPGSVSIESYAFAYCAYLHTVELGEGFSKIEQAVFINCTSLINVKLPSTLRTIESYAFATCTRLYTITLPEGLESIRSCAFADASLVFITLPSSLKTIESEAFLECNRLFVVNNLSTLCLSKRDESHGGVAYYANEINTAVDNSNVYITNDGFIFYNNGELNVLLEYVGTGKTTLILPELFMGEAYFLIDKAFADFDVFGWEDMTVYDIVCWEIEATHSGKNVSTIVIPKTLTAIPRHAFTGWENIEYIYFEGSEEEWENVTIVVDLGSNATLSSAQVVFYSEEEPSNDNPCWHYVDGIPVLW